jgi:hypothetical protein
MTKHIIIIVKIRISNSSFILTTTTIITTQHNNKQSTIEEILKVKERIKPPYFFAVISLRLMFETSLPSFLFFSYVLSLFSHYFVFFVQCTDIALNFLFFKN